MESGRIVRTLFRPNGENVLASYFEFDREGWAKIGSLRDRATRQEISRKCGHSQRVEERAAARVPHHRMFGAVESIFAFQLAQIRDVLELAIAERRLRRKRPVTTRLRWRSRRQPDEQRRNIFSRESIVDIELFGAPRLGHF